MKISYIISYRNYIYIGLGIQIISVSIVDILNKVLGRKYENISSSYIWNILELFFKISISL